MQEFPPEVILLVSLISDRLGPSSSVGFPMIADVFVYEQDGDSVNLDVIMAPAPGMTMLVNFSPLFEEGDLCGNEREFARRTCDSALHVSRLADDIRPQLAKFSRCVQGLARAARRSGLPVEIVGIHVAEPDPSCDVRSVRFVAVMEVLGANLRPTRLHLNAGDEYELKQLFGSDMDALAWRAIVRKRLMRAKADGVIDLMSLNAIERHGELYTVLRNMLDRQGMVVADDVELIWRDGEIYSTSGEGARLGWTGSVVSVNDLIVTETRCVTAVGRFASELVDHWVLKGEIILRSINSNSQDGAAYTILEVEAPRFFFNVDSGELWPVC